MLVQDRQRIGPERARRVIADRTWALLVTHGEGGLIASHLPALVDDREPDELVILAHTARADPQAARIRDGEELLLVFQGEHGYLPGAWAGGHGAAVGTWNFEVVHAYGRPQLLDPGGSLDVLRRTFEHLEARREDATPWSAVAGIAEAIVGGTCCFRVPVARLEAKAKLGQEKPREVREQLIAGLERPGPYHQPALAALMRAAL